MSRDAFDADATTGVKLMIEDETTAIDIVAYGGAADKLDGVYAGDEIRVKRATLGQNNRGIPEITVSNATEVDVVDVGIDVAGEDVDDGSDGDEDADEVGKDDTESKVVDVDEKKAIGCLRDVVGESSNGAVTRSCAAYKLSDRGVASSQIEGTAVVKQLIDDGMLREVGGDEVTVISGGGD
jgi:hypothetical protein